MDLNHARLPIPPLRRRCSRIYTGFSPGVNDYGQAFLRIRFWLVLKSTMRQAVASNIRL
jgi:hypothetical protein